MSDPEPIDLSDEVASICRKVAADPDYVASVHISPDAIRLALYVGEQGRCKGPKAIDRNDRMAEPVMTTEEYPITVVSKSDSPSPDDSPFDMPALMEGYPVPKGAEL